MCSAQPMAQTVASELNYMDVFFFFDELVFANEAYLPQFLLTDWLLENIVGQTKEEYPDIVLT